MHSQPKNSSSHLLAVKQTWKRLLKETKMRLNLSQHQSSFMRQFHIQFKRKSVFVLTKSTKSLISQLMKAIAIKSYPRISQIRDLNSSRKETEEIKSTNRWMR